MLELLEIKAMGLIPDPAFEGWSVKDGTLISPLDKRLTASDIENLSIIHQRASWLPKRIEQLEGENEKLRGYVDIWRIRAGEQPAANDDGNREL